ncbi:receptor-interacting serine/threonine-protein kinase 2-like [Amphiura filiformis]|uniref:receptor-interacting serine/threonine-protein kinase 2-like n=1 Tax=Amphiura filiformis TaxID=82378 RepID=UPI003B215DC8
MCEGMKCQYLVNILGYINEPDNLSIVMEYFEIGNLKEFNRKFMMAGGVMTRKIRMILDISNGMNYLHTRDTPIFHSDLKLENVFVGGDFTVKIGDFGFAVSRASVSLHEMGGTFTHFPPEAYDNAKVDELWDIYTLEVG